MRTRNYMLAAFVLILAGCEFGDEITAFSSGTPVRLISATGSLDAFDAHSDPLQPLLHASLRENNLRLVVRTSFYSAGTLARPYLTVDAEQHGVLHIDTKSQLVLFSNKCEFLRQFEVEIPSEQWNGLRSLKIYNHDIGQWASGTIELANGEYMAALLRDSSEQVALQDLAGVGHGC